MLKNNFTLYVHEIFHADLLDLITKVKKVKKESKKIYGSNYKDSDHYKLNEFVKKLSQIRKFIKEQVPQDCSHHQYYGTPPLDNCFRRVKWNERYRLYFQYDLQNKEITYLWFNNENCLRSRGSKTDCYNVFNNMVKNGIISLTFFANKHIQYQEPLEKFK